MREIKFMAWNKDLKIMRRVMKINLYDGVTDNGIFKSVEVVGIRGIETVWLSKDCELRQFTGLDKNGKEIYEV